MYAGKVSVPEPFVPKNIPGKKNIKIRSNSKNWTTSSK